MTTPDHSNPGCDPGEYFREVLLEGTNSGRYPEGEMGDLKEIYAGASSDVQGNLREVVMEALENSDGSGGRDMQLMGILSAPEQEEPGSVQEDCKIDQNSHYGAI